MKTLLIADTHFDTSFEPARYKAIIRLIKSVDRVVIAGDFWDSFLCSFDEFVDSGWNKMFPLLKEKKTIYIHGNHDRPKHCNERVKLFSVKQLDKYTLETKEQSFLIEHGHTLASEFEQRHAHITKIFRGLYPWLDARFGGHGIFGPMIVKFIEFNHNQLWKRMKIRLESNQDWLAGKQQLVVGHCHFQKKNTKLRLQSIGSFRWGVARYGIIGPQGLEVFEERYD
jgi:predicted phosphodiesterase